MDRRTGTPVEVALRVRVVEELFEATRGSLDAPVPGAPPGIERVLDELTPARLDQGVRLTVMLPAAEVYPNLDNAIAGAVARWCHERRRENDHTLRALRRDGTGALVPGSILLAIGLLAAEGVRRSPLPVDLRILGDGIAIVVAWVAMWYPLDTLLYSRRPYRRANEVLDAMAHMEVAITPT